MTHDGSAHGHTLALTAGQFAGLTIQEVFQTKDFSGFFDLFPDQRLANPAHPEAEGHILKDG